jgi:hypothetical protein
VNCKVVLNVRMGGLEEWMMGCGEVAKGVGLNIEWWDGKALGRAKERLGRMGGGMRRLEGEK